MKLRLKRRGKIGRSWCRDETYVKVNSRWCYLYEAIDRDGNLLDSMLSEKRDKLAVRRFLRQLFDSAELKPLRVTTDKHPAYSKAIRWIIGRKVTHRHNQYLNNRMEQDHRHIKQRYYPILGFKRFDSTSRFCTAFDELRDYMRLPKVKREQVSAADRRRTLMRGYRRFPVQVGTLRGRARMRFAQVSQYPETAVYYLFGDVAGSRMYGISRGASN
jgi:putative transposase